MAKAKDTNPLASLADLGAALQEAAGEQEKEKEVLDQILHLLEGLDKDSATALFKNEAVQALIERASAERVQSSTDVPGTIYTGILGGVPIKGLVKKPWTEADLRKKVESGEMVMVYFTPSTTVPVTYQGIRRQFIADQEMYVEKCFVDVYQNSRQEQRKAAEHAAWLMRKRDTISDWSMVTPEGARARATGERGHYVPGGGNITERVAEDQGAASAS